METKTIRLTRPNNKILITTAVMAALSLFIWYTGLHVNVYQNAFLGAVFEMIWLPNMLLSGCIPIVCGFFWWKSSFSIKSGFPYLMLLYPLGVAATFYI